MIKKWYFAINDSGVEGYEYMIKAAVLSAQKYTSLLPHCIYYGQDAAIMGWLRDHDVRIINRTSSFIDEIHATADNGNWTKAIATGAYLRLDIPIIEVEDEYVLYTDCDVLFTENFSAPEDRPEYFSAAPENEIDNWSFFNTGVMVINVPAMRGEMQRIRTETRGRLNGLWKTGRGTYDQGILNETFKDAWNRLNPIYNWKPYWGVNPDAKIIHFHGPKPAHIFKIISNNTDRIPSLYQNMVARSPVSMSHYLEVFDEFNTRNVQVMYRGFIDGFSVSGENLVIGGWICVNGRSVDGLKVYLNGCLAVCDSFVKIEREHVANKFNLSDTMLGFEVRVSVKQTKYPIHFSVFSSDARFRLPSSLGQDLTVAN